MNTPHHPAAPAAPATILSLLPVAELMRQRAALAPLWLLSEEDMSDAECDRLSAQWSAIEDELLHRPARTPEDLAAKFEVWAHLISDPACILAEHMELFAELQRDCFAMARAAQ